MTLMYLALAYLMAVTAGGLFSWCMFLAARRGDDGMAEALRRRERAQEHEAEAQLYGSPWRSR